MSGGGAADVSETRSAAGTVNALSLTSSSVLTANFVGMCVEPVLPGDKTVGHDLTVDQGVVAGTTVEGVGAWATDEDVVTVAAGDRVVAVATDQDVVAGTAVNGERHGASS